MRADSQWVAPEGSWASDEATRNKMLANRSRDTKPELLVRSLLHRSGLRYRVNQRPLPELRRTADIVFRKARVAVFIDGCFWHGCPDHYKKPSANAKYWSDKVEGNKRRDQGTDALLVESGWTVLRFWEHEPPERVAMDVEAKLLSRSVGSASTTQPPP